MSPEPDGAIRRTYRKFVMNSVGITLSVLFVEAHSVPEEEIGIVTLADVDLSRALSADKRFTVVAISFRRQSISYGQIFCRDKWKRALVQEQNVVSKLRKPSTVGTSYR